MQPIRQKRRRCLGCLAAALLGGASALRAVSTIDPAHPYAYGANVGWLSARADGLHGAATGQYYCTGHVWSANTGWIGLGSGRPANGYGYANNSAADWGVNHDGEGRLSGCGYGANIGWVSFEQLYGRPRLDLRSGVLSGSAWGANVGWIEFSNAQAYVRTQSLDSGPDDDEDRLPDPYEYRHTETLTALSGLDHHDADGDGAADLAESVADTDPLDDGDVLRIVAVEATLHEHWVAWTCRPTRFYRLEAADAPTGSGEWIDAGPGPLGPCAVSPLVHTVSAVTGPMRIYRVQVLLPLSE